MTRPFGAGVVRGAALACAALLCAAGTAVAQRDAAAVERERADYVRWLRDVPISPFRALALHPLGDGLTLGPAGSDIPLDGLPEHRLVPQGRVAALEGPAGRRLVPRDRPIPVGLYTAVVGGPPDRTVVTLYGPASREVEPAFYPYDPALAFTGRLTPVEEPRSVRLLAADGVEVDATEAGTVAVRIGGAVHRLRVRRIPVPGTEESELEIYFRDATNGAGSYPAGRFVVLVPLGDGRYRLDFNRARNPFCAYSTVYPCPVPWPGNMIAAPVEAGERYGGGGLEVPVPAGGVE